MQTTKSPVNGQTPTEMGSTQSKKHNELAPDTQSNNSAQQNSGVQGPVVFRNNHESAASAQMGPQKERFSVPNLTDHRASCSASQNENIIHKEQYQTQGSVRELASKLERHNPAIVPQVTNEGLVTPVMRRKQFGNKQNRTAAILPTIDSAHCSDQSPEDLNTNRAAAICMDANDGEGFIVHTSPTFKDSTPVSSLKQVLTVSKSLKVGPSSSGQPNPPPASLKPKSKLNAMDVESETTSQPVSPMSINDDENGPESPRQPVIIHEKLLGSAYPIQAVQMPHDQFQMDGNESSVNGMPFLRAQHGQHNRISKTIATVRPQQYMQSSPEQANILINGQESHSPVTEEPPPKRQSEYAQLSELAQYFEGDGIEHNATEVAATSTNCAEENMGSEEDAVSIAETDFNEPWDSNAWENLLDLAKFGDEKPSTATAIRALHSNDTIIEEDDVSCSASTSGCESEDKYRELIDRRNHGIAREKKALKQLAIATYYGYESESLADEEECNEENHFGFESDLNENGSTNGTDRIFGSLGSRKTNSIGNRTKNTSKAPSRAESQVSSAAPDEWGNEAAAMAAILASKTGECVGATEIADKNTQRDQPKSPSRLNWLTKDGSNSTKMDEDNGNEPRYGRSLSSVKSCQIGNRQPRPKLGTQISSASLQRGRNYRASHSENHNGSITDLRFPSASPVISPARLRTKSSINHGDGDPNLTLQRYVELLASDENTVFGATLHRFIECTVESEETDPSVVIRRVRQFLNGMKNYLVKNGELDLHRLIERETDKLNSNEFLNIDAIFEAVLSKILLVPIKPHLYHLMVRENTRNGELQRLSENLSLIRSMEPAEFGFSTKTQMPDHKSMDRIRNLLRKMQDHYSPLKKLDNLLRILSMMLRRPRSPGEVNGNFSSVDRDRSSPVSTPGGPSPAPNRQIHASVSMDRGLAAASPSNMFMIKHSGGISSLASMNKHPPVEDMIRWLVYVLSKASAINCEIEAWYMWELMPQQLLTTGDAAFYLSTLFSAVQVLKHPDSLRRLNTIASADACTLMGSMTTLQESTETEVSDSFLRIAIPNEQEGAIEYHTFPVLPQMNVVKLCRVIASQFAITNPEDYGLYILFDGFETFLLPKEYPHTIRDQLSVAGKPHLFAYKRNDARIAWPKNAVTCCTPTAIEAQPRLY
ncbi:protein sprint [Ditylenchus destructor]|nr:protein sprint [Ditylenchus destructor]